MNIRSFRKAFRLTLSAVLLLPAIGISAVAPIRQASAATVDPTVYNVNVSSTDQQTVKGWGVFPSWNRADWNRNFIPATGAQDALFNDLGISMFRVMIPAVAGDENGNVYDDKMQEIYDLIQTGETRGKHDYIISVWSPPIGMKTIPTVNGWTGTEHVRLRADKEDAFTDYLVNSIQWLQNKGASVPKAISFQNEPLSTIISEWCYWGGDNGVQYQRVAKLLRSKLDAAGLTGVQILGPEGAAYYENEQLFGQGFSALTNDPVLNDAIGGIASHSYFAKGFDTTGVYQNYVNVLNQVPDKDRWQTEYSANVTGGISQIDMAINASQRLASDMAFIGNDYWFWWLGWAANRHPTDNGEVLLDGDGVTVTKSKAFNVLSKIFNNAPVGSKVRRITADAASGLTTDNSVWMDGVAFVNGDTTSALLVNPTDQAKTVKVNGLTGVSANVYQDTADIPVGQDMKLSAVRNIFGGTAADIVLPAKSVSVIVTSDTDTAPPLVAFDQTSSSNVNDADYAVRNSQFTVSGHLDEPGTLQINDQPVDVADDLSFSTTVTLKVGSNTITAAATDVAGNQGQSSVLNIRYDPTYLGLSVDQSSPIYVRQSAFTVSGHTNGSAAVDIKQEFNGEVVDDITQNVGGGGSGGHTAGELIQSLASNGWPTPGTSGAPLSGALGSVYMGLLGAGSGGFTVGAQGVWDNSTTFAPAEGSSSLRLKLGDPSTGGFARLNFDFLNSSWQGITQDLSSYRSMAALQFWVNASATDSSFAVAVESNNGTRVEARLPLANYLAASDYTNKWAKVTVPLSDFDAAVHYAPSTDRSAFNQTVSDPIDWSKINGFAFLSNATKFISPRVDDIKLVYVNDSSTETGPLTFSGDLNLQIGDNTVTVSAANDAGVQAAPAVIHAIYDPDAPILTVPDSGTATTTSYVLKGSVNEPATVTVNGAAVNLQSDNSFTAIVPVVKGINTIAVVATDPAGNSSSATVSVDCNPAEDGAVAPGVAAGNKTASPPVIDGDLSDTGWKVDNLVQKTIIGTPDNHVSFGTMWDDNSLYVAVRVLDANLANDSDQAYQDDSVEIYVDGNNERSATYGSDDHQITLGWHDSQLSVGGDVDGIQYAQQDIDGGYSVEMAIPWSGIGVPAPKAGSVIGFDVGNNDDDGLNNGSRESQLLWAGDNNNWQSTARFGALYLNDGKNVTAALEHAGSMTVDGALTESDWRLNGNVTKTITGSPNNAVSFGTLSDSQNLYVGVQVLDSVLKNDSDQAYQDDSVEIYLDSDNSQSTAYDGNDHQITLGWHDSQLSVGGDVAGIQYAQKDIDGGYTVEMAIPWSSLNVTPARDITLGFDVGINDDDGNNNGNRESQSMWNGTANNWQDTSGFGHLLVHNLSLPLPTVIVTEPEGLAELTDDAHDFSKLYAKSAHIAVQTTHPENFANDAASFIHSNDNPDPAEYVVYRSPAGDIYSFDMATGLYSTTPQFTFFGSADGENYTPITVNSKLTGGANGYSVWSNTATNLPSGIKYLKAVFPGKLNWNERLLNVSFKYFDEQTPPLASIALTADKTALQSGNTASLTVAGVLSDGSEADLSPAQIAFASDDEQTATVDSAGSVTAVQEGTARLTATVTLSGVTLSAGVDVIVDSTPPAFSLSANGNTLAQGGSFDDEWPLTFKAWDTLTGLTDAKLAIDGEDYAVDPQSADGATVDLVGQVGAHTATITAEDLAGNRLEIAFPFTVTTSIDSMKHLLARYAGDAKQVLTNELDQAHHQMDDGRPEQAAKHIQDFIKHLDNEALAGSIENAGKTVLINDGNALTALWTK
ncbi:sugar-binding protein [Cohnella zeiphila]|uniref:Ig-like domain-containing protein n=1 Tax=Cohnella zeiphila TaxID=2761120 RepID=A0A7X0SV69_9BACL|nr:sugar-binding protein [Cohnella zeiphila]MBB6734463.1 Ig-like domain-containing protein [Cohnella zeiphila]